MLMNHISRSDDARFPKRWTEEAVSLAMESRWAEAVAVNRKILELAPDDVGTLNRLGRALMEMGQYNDARDAYTRTLGLSPSNPIAQRNLERLATLHEEARPAATAAKVDLQMFVPEPGKAAITTIKLKGKAAALAKVAVGEQVSLVVDGHALGVRDARGELLGAVEQRLAYRIIELMNGGNHYGAALVSAGNDAARIVIRETYQDPSQLGKVSFPAQEGTAPGGSAEGGASFDADEEEALSDEEDAGEGTDEQAVNMEEESAQEDAAPSLYMV
jgi:tetratricopeptide (TPR) repeat protein